MPSSHQSNGKNKNLEEVQEEIKIIEVQQTNVILEQEAHREYIRALSKEESMWRLNSRSLWLQVGDKNTAFFHRQAKAKQCINQVTEIKTHSRETISDFDQIKQQDTEHFTELYPSEGDINKERSNLFLSYTPHMISEIDYLNLNRPIEEDEIFKAIQQFHLDKAPGPDGFTLHFYKIC